MVDCDRDRDGLAREVEQAAGRLAADQVGHLYLTATLSRSQLLVLAASDRVLWVDVASDPEEDMDVVRQFSGANYVESQAGMTGKGVRGHIFEGIVAGHQEFAAVSPWRGTPISYLNAASNTHGSATFGVIFAKGVVAKARGLLPDGQGLYTNYSGINRYNCVADLVNPTKGLEAMFQTASWGYARTTSYLSTSAEMDKIILDHDLPITQSQSNAGSTSVPRDSRPQAWAKNIISIGGIRHYDTVSPADDRWLGAGSIGPAEDGRIKPDLCSFYDATYTTYSSSTTGYSNFSGTSNATPVNAGHLGLTIEMFTDGAFGHKASAWNKRFADRPHAQTSKAMMINSAWQYPFSGTSHDLTRTHQGWGHPHVGNLYNKKDGTLIADEYDVVKQGDVRRYFVMVDPPQGELKVTMCYRDVEGTTSASLHRINDLDLEVIDPKGTSYHGNNGLLAGNYSTSGGSKNTVDTVENVFVSQPMAGVWEVRVSAPTVTRDTHAATTAVDATFALVVSGLRGLRDTTGPVLTLTTQGQGDLSFKLANAPKGYTEGWTLLSLTMRPAPGHGDLLGIQFDALAATILGWPASVGDPLHFKATTSANQFPNAEYKIPAGALSFLKGLSLDGVTLFVDANGPLDVSNVSRVTL
ncbi:MAG: S8 family serine peptidase [Planctomycetota bacterium]